jgi:uncharacterized damage-inducible protein DinB
MIWQAKPILSKGDSMSKMWQLFIALFLVALSSYGIAQEVPKPGKDDAKKTHEVEEVVKPELNVANVLKTSITHLQRTFLPLAMAMPDNKYGFAPTDGEFKGVRTFGQQLKHVAASNYVYASSILGEKPPADVGEEEDGPASMKTKDEILKYVNDSFAYVQKAVATINAKNLVSPIKNPFGQGEATRLAIATLIIGHCNDHYGQMVEYVRMNGIVPPASQR